LIGYGGIKGQKSAREKKIWGKTKKSSNTKKKKSTLRRKMGPKGGGGRKIKGL